VKKYQHSTKDS